jgi:hypothetical protein
VALLIPPARGLQCEPVFQNIAVEQSCEAPRNADRLGRLRRDLAESRAHGRYGSVIDVSDGEAVARRYVREDL